MRVRSSIVCGVQVGVAMHGIQEIRCIGLQGREGHRRQHHGTQFAASKYMLFRPCFDSIYKPYASGYCTGFSGSRSGHQGSLLRPVVTRLHQSAPSADKKYYYKARSDTFLQTAHRTAAYTKHGNCRSMGEALSLGQKYIDTRINSAGALLAIRLLSDVFPQYIRRLRIVSVQ